MRDVYKSPLNYTGAKDKLISTLEEYFPDNVDTFYDVFCGGLSVTINTRYNKIVSNDIISPMIEFYKEIQNLTIDELINNVNHYKIEKNKDDFNNLRLSFNNTKSPYEFFALVSSCTNNMMRFNKKFDFNQTFGNRTVNDNTIKKLIDYHRIITEKEITFTNKHYKNLLQESNITPNDFVYLDPPYMMTEAGYNAYWSIKDEEELYKQMDILNKNNIKFLMSNVKIHKGKLNPYWNEIKKWNVIDINYNYEKVAKIKNLESQEIIIKNF